MNHIMEIYEHGHLQPNELICFLYMKIMHVAPENL